MTRSRTRATARLAAAIVLAGGTAAAAPLRATVSFPSGLQVGQVSPIRVTLAPGQDAEAGRRALERLDGQGVALVLEGGQYGLAAQVPLGKIGAGPLQGRITPRSPGPHRVSLRFGNGALNFAEVQEIVLPARAGTLTFVFEGPESRRSVPLVQVLAWAVGAAALGLVALRGAFAF